jgi:hypothetical protein
MLWSQEDDGSQEHILEVNKVVLQVQVKSDKDTVCS